MTSLSLLKTMIVAEDSRHVFVLDSKPLVVLEVGLLVLIEVLSSEKKHSMSGSKRCFNLLIITFSASPWTETLFFILYRS